MTNKELIEALSSFPEEAIVKVDIVRPILEITTEERYQQIHGSQKIIEINYYDPQTTDPENEHNLPKMIVIYGLLDMSPEMETQCSKCLINKGEQ